MAPIAPIPHRPLSSTSTSPRLTREQPLTNINFPSLTSAPHCFFRWTVRTPFLSVILMVKFGIEIMKRFWTSAKHRSSNSMPSSSLMSACQCVSSRLRGRAAR